MTSLLKENEKVSNTPFSIRNHLPDPKKEILVIAIANLHREPDYWEDRI
jgi:hypothetical protein